MASSARRAAQIVPAAFVALSLTNPAREGVVYDLTSYDGVRHTPLEGRFARA